MEFNQVIQQRYSVRKYQETGVEEEKLADILHAGCIAPTARNLQPWRVMVVKSPQGLAQMEECTPCAFGAPVVFIMCFDKGLNNKGGNYARVDASIAMTHMMLKATELGLGTVWVGFFDHDELHARFQIPNEYEIVSLLPLGYPAPEAKPSAMHANRNSVEQFLLPEPEFA